MLAILNAFLDAIGGGTATFSSRDGGTDTENFDISYSSVVEAFFNL